jgi:hypothetical protein
VKNPRKFRRVLRALDAAVAALPVPRLELAAAQYPEHRATLRQALDLGGGWVPAGLRPWVMAVTLPLGGASASWPQRVAREPFAMVDAASLHRVHERSFTRGGAVRRLLRKLPARWRTTDAAREVACAVEMRGAGAVGLAIGRAGTRGQFLAALLGITSPYLASKFGAQYAADTDAEDTARRAA